MDVYQRKIKLRHSRRHFRHGIIWHIRNNSKEPVHYPDYGAWNDELFSQWGWELGNMEPNKEAYDEQEKLSNRIRRHGGVSFI